MGRMDMTEDAELLSRFAKESDEAAFRELVARHLNLVYSVALRQLNGDAHLAQDVAQGVFTDLARKARALARHVVLAGWLYEAARYSAAKVVRGEQRRRAREEEAMAMQDPTPEATPEWERLRPVLDTAMGELNTTERNAVLLRFFERQDYRAVGAALGVSEDAAQKRVSRALEKLRTTLARNGVTLSASALTAAIMGEAVQAVPAGLVVSVATASLAGASAAAATGFAVHVLEIIAMTKIKIIAAAVIAASIGTPLVLQQRAKESLRTENAALRQQASGLAELDQLRAENQRLAKVRVDAEELDRARLERPELMRLRGEVGLLRRRLQDLQLPNAAKRAASAPADRDAAGAGKPGEHARLEPGFYEAEQWSDQGLGSPQNSTLTFLWSLRTGHAQEYAESLGKTTDEPLPIEWANALGRIKGSQLSETLTSAEGQPMVGLLHELDDGTSANTWLGLGETNGKWIIKSVIGFPIKVFKIEK